MSTVTATETGNVSCALARHISTDGAVLTAHVLIVLFDALSFLIGGIYMVTLAGNRGIHMNVRCVGVSVAFCLVLRNTITFYRSGRKILLAILQASECDFLEWASFCSFQSFVGRYPVNVSIMGMDVLALERVLATILYRQYERRVFPPVAIFLGFLPWVIQTCRSIDQLQKMNFTSPERRNYCESISSIGLDLGAAIVQVAPISAIAVGLSIATFIFNHRIKTFATHTGYDGTHHLTEQFQRRENVETSKVVLVQSFGLLTAYVLTAYTAFLISWTRYQEFSHFVRAKEFSSLIFPVYGSVHCLLALAVSPNQRKCYLSCRFFQVLTRKNRQSLLAASGMQVAPLAQSDDYFKHYAAQW